MKRIPIHTGNPYTVYIGKGILEKLTTLLPEKAYQKVALISDDNVYPLYGKTVRMVLEQAGFLVETFVFPHGEQSKTLSIIEQILSFLSEKGFTRSDLLVALGGGVVGDTAGFAASIYQRGIDYIQIPTTFLSAIDSSVGGKTAVNIPQGKNLVGSFWQPRLVLCDVKTLDTLDTTTFEDGIAEAIKYGCIWDTELFSWFENGELDRRLLDSITRCVEIKAEVVSQDEQDTGLRQILNFGHTMGHAIEKQSHFQITHGRAVAIGMCYAAFAGEQANLTKIGTLDRIHKTLQRYNLPITSPYDKSILCKQCLGDKKRSGSHLNLILLKDIGEAFIHSVSIDKLSNFLCP